MTDDRRQRAYWDRDQGLRSYDHPVVRLFARQRVDVIRSLLDPSTIRRALDVGCGDGFSTYYTGEAIPGVWATDRSGWMLARHPLRSKARLTIADARALPYAGESFDLVYGWEILHHVSDPVSVVKEMARVSQRYVLVMEPNRNNPAQFAFAVYDPEHRWVLRYSRTYLEWICRQAGLRIVHSMTGGYILPNRMPLWMARAVRRLPFRSPVGITNCVLAERA